MVYIVEEVIKVINNPTKSNLNCNHEASTSSAPCKVYNIVNNSLVKLIDFITAIENKLGKTIEKNMIPMREGDFLLLFHTSDLVEYLGYRVKKVIQEGISDFVDCYLRKDRSER